MTYIRGFTVPNLIVWGVTTGYGFLAPTGCFTNISWTLQNNLMKMHYTRKHIYGEHLKLELCTCTQSMALGACSEFKFEILIRSTISAIHKFQENILKNSRNISDTAPWSTSNQLACVLAWLEKIEAHNLSNIFTQTMIRLLYSSKLV